MFTSAQAGMFKRVSDSWTFAEIPTCVMLITLLLVDSNVHHVWSMSHPGNMNIHLDVCHIGVGKICIFIYLTLSKFE